MTTNTIFRPLLWEPVQGTGERLTAGVILNFGGELSTHRIIRDDVLDSLYGKSSSSPKKLIDTALNIYLDLAKECGLDSLHSDVFGLSPGETRYINADSITEAIRISALMFSSLANMTWIDELEIEDTPTQEDTNRRFFTEVKQGVVASRPDLSVFFNRSAKLLNDGQLVKFGFLSDSAVLHFNVLSPVRQPSGVRDARARLWELARARDYGSIAKAALITAYSPASNPTLTLKQVESIKNNLYEINREADAEEILFYPVESVTQGSQRVIALVA